MQLRSGKIIQTMSDSNGAIYKRIYNYYENTGENHLIILESKKSQKVESQSQNQQTIHFQSIIKAEQQSAVYRDWLIARLKGLIADLNKYNNLPYKQRVLERTQLFVEMVAVLREHVDYIVSSPMFCNFVQTLSVKLFEFKNVITSLLNGEDTKSDTYEPCDFSYMERTFLGNARVDIVNLLTIIKPHTSAVLVA